ncbi:MAG: hypothetical protein GY742_19110 [Hyphomicrobiales bacterium]|nr:hypothetical protein [Hyphomicrobiales bacterium]
MTLIRSLPGAQALRYSARLAEQTGMTHQTAPVSSQPAYHSSQFFVPSGLRYALLMVNENHGEKPASPKDAKNWSNESV